MANPFVLIRRYQYSMMVVFGVLLMVSFIIAPIVMDWLRMRAETAGGAASSAGEAATASGGAMAISPDGGDA